MAGRVWGDASSEGPSTAWESSGGNSGSSIERRFITNGPGLDAESQVGVWAGSGKPKPTKHLCAKKSCLNQIGSPASSIGSPEIGSPASIMKKSNRIFQPTKFRVRLGAIWPDSKIKFEGTNRRMHFRLNFLNLLIFFAFSVIMKMIFFPAWFWVGFPVNRRPLCTKEKFQRTNHSNKCVVQTKLSVSHWPMCLHLTLNDTQKRCQHKCKHDR